MIKGSDIGAVNRHFRRMSKLEAKYPETRFPGKPGMAASRPLWRHLWIATERTGPCRTETLVACGKNQQDYKISHTQDPSEVTCPRCLEAMEEVKVSEKKE